MVQAITEKLMRRHPHVFGDKGGMATHEVNVQWDQIKEEEKAARAASGRTPAPGRDGALAGVSPGLPALARALKLQQKAGKVGFDWNDPKAVLAKIREEADEIASELDSGTAGEGRGRDRRSVVRGRQPRAPPRCRSGQRAARRPI